MTQRRYSVVIPTHLRPELLRNSILSVVAQTLAPHEILVVSDLDDPAVELLCEGLAAAASIAIRYVFDPESPGGASASRNAGAQTASGDYFAFLDDDDLWHPEYLDSADRAFDEHGTEMIVTWRSLVKGEVRVDGPAMKRNLEARDVVAASLGTTGSNIVVEREAFWRCGGFDPAMPVKNDTDFVFRFLLAGGSYDVVERRLVDQVKHGQGQLTNGNERRIAGTKLYMKKHARHLRLRDRRHLMLTIRRMQYHAARSPLSRLGYLTLALANYSPWKYLEERDIRRAWIELERPTQTGN